MSVIMKNLKRHISSRLISIVVLGLLIIVPDSADAQQQRSSKQMYVVPFIGIGTVSGDVEVAYSPLESAGYSNYTRNWQFHAGFNFTAKFLFWQSQFEESERSRLSKLGLLGGIDICLVPGGAKQITSSEGVHTSANDNLKETFIYLAPCLVFKAPQVPFHILMAVGINHRVWDKSRIEGIDLKNSIGTSVIGVIRFRSLWTGISIHHGQYDSSVTDNFSGQIITPINLSSRTVWLHIGVNGWEP